MCVNQTLILYTDKQAILETLVFAEVHDQLNPLLPVVVIKGMDGMISLVEEFVYDRLLLFLASRTQIMPYLYYRTIDKLLCFKDPLSYGLPQQEAEDTGLTGSMILD